MGHNPTVISNSILPTYLAIALELIFAPLLRL